MTSWQMAKGLLIRDAVAAGISIGISVAFVAVAFVVICVKDWRARRRFKLKREHSEREGRNLVRDEPPAEQPPSYGPGRCEICGWTLHATMVGGCVPGNCSYRPENPDDRRRIQDRRHALGVDRLPPAEQPSRQDQQTTEDQCPATKREDVASAVTTVTTTDTTQSAMVVKWVRDIDSRPKDAGR